MPQGAIPRQRSGPPPTPRRANTEDGNPFRGLLLGLLFVAPYWSVALLCIWHYVL